VYSIRFTFDAGMLRRKLTPRRCGNDDGVMVRSRGDRGFSLRRMSLDIYQYLRPTLSLVRPFRPEERPNAVQSAENWSNAASCASGDTTMMTICKVQRLRESAA